jgi:hypothetical protein
MIHYTTSTNIFDAPISEATHAIGPPGALPLAVDPVRPAALRLPRLPQGAPFGSRRPLCVRTARGVAAFTAGARVLCQSEKDAKIAGP